MKLERKKTIKTIIARSLATILLIVYICLHFILTIYSSEIDGNIGEVRLDFGFGKTNPYDISLFFFFVGLILNIICFILLKNNWKVVILLFSILYIMHYIIFILVAIIYMNIVFWSGLIVNSIIVIFYKGD